MERVRNLAHFVTEDDFAIQESRNLRLIDLGGERSGVSTLGTVNLVIHSADVYFK